MDNNKTKIDLTQETPLKDKVTELKLIARDSLRMELISKRLTKISDLEIIMENSNKETERLNKELKTQEYDLEKTDTNHPKYEDRKKIYEKRIELYKKLIEKEEKEKTEIQEKLDNQLEGIILIETGETKVNLENLNNYVSELIKENARKKQGRSIRKITN